MSLADDGGPGDTGDYVCNACQASVAPRRSDADLLRRRRGSTATRQRGEIRAEVEKEMYAISTRSRKSRRRPLALALVPRASTTAGTII